MTDKESHKSARPRHDQIVIFDGVCNFCNGAVNFIIQRDPSARFTFTPMQSEFAQELLKRYDLKIDGMDTFALIQGDRALVFSSAALEIAKNLSGYWYLFSVFKVIPAPIRDFFYKLFARRRYAMFGKSATCIVPSEEIKSRFLGLE